MTIGVDIMKSLGFWLPDRKCVWGNGFYIPLVDTGSIYTSGTPSQAQGGTRSLAERLFSNR